MNSRALISFGLSVFLLGVTSCTREGSKDFNLSAARESNQQSVAVVTQATEAKAAVPNHVSFDSLQAEDVTPALDRKIIRNADLTLEVPSTADTQHKIVSIAEAHGGFVVTSESKQRENVEPAKRTIDIKLVVRIPENQFLAAVDQIRSLSPSVPKEEKITGQDVTEEFIDLEARIKTQRALEAQFLLIMKQTGKIEDALDVQRQIAEVRSEIEKLEGRKRFLENRSSLSTITVNLEAPTPIVVVPATGFRSSVREAVSDSIDVGSALVLFFVRFAIVMVPIVLLVLLPGGLVVRYFIRRNKRFRLAAALSGPAAD